MSTDKPKDRSLNDATPAEWDKAAEEHEDGLGPMPAAPFAPSISHSELVAKLSKSGKDILASITPIDCHIMHMAMGISGEAGEVLDEVKKVIMYCKSPDVSKIIEELGDVEFYLEGLRQGLGISRATILKANIAKLSKRYSSGSYSDKQAKERADKKDEQ